MYNLRCSTKSAGVIVRRGNKILLLERAFFPFGWACPAGHLKSGEKPISGMRRETKEETGLAVTNPRLLLKKARVKNKCVKGSPYHDWYIFEGKARGRLKRSKTETKGISWFTPSEIKKLKLEPIWKQWLRELRVI